MSERKISMVREGYEVAAENYRTQKTLHLLNLSIFKQWFSLLQTGPVLDLGCGSGFPVCHAFLEKFHPYQGVDLAEKQIQLALQTYPQVHYRFFVGEMLQYCRDSPSGVFGGVLSLFSIFHLPRELHRALFIEMKRITQPKAPILISLGETEGEEVQSGWLGAEKMFWSNYSIHWYQDLLSELNFQILDDFREEVEFNDEIEVNWYLLFQQNN